MNLYEVEHKTKHYDIELLGKFQIVASDIDDLAEKIGNYTNYGAATITKITLLQENVAE